MSDSRQHRDGHEDQQADARLANLYTYLKNDLTHSSTAEYDLASGLARFTNWLDEASQESAHISLATAGEARSAAVGQQSLAAYSQVAVAVGGGGTVSPDGAPDLFGPRSAGPTVQRLILGGHLRRLREEAFITTDEAAAAIRGSRSKISRMELGRIAFKQRDIEDLLTLYGVTGGEEREALLRLAREANTPGWWQGYSDILPHWVEPYFGLEASATFIRTWETQCVPGLLQTEAYARAMLRLGNATSEEDVLRRAEARLARQDILNREHPPRLWAVVDESVLRRPIGGREVLADQIRHLIDMAEHPAVTLQVLPFGYGSHPALGGPFTILRFTEPDLPDVVYIEQLTSAIYLDKPADLESYLEVMEQLCLQAEPAFDTPRLLTEILNEL